MPLQCSSSTSSLHPSIVSMVRRRLSYQARCSHTTGGHGVPMKSTRVRGSSTATTATTNTIRCGGMGSYGRSKCPTATSCSVTGIGFESVVPSRSYNTASRMPGGGIRRGRHSQQQQQRQQQQREYQFDVTKHNITDSRSSSSSYYYYYALASIPMLVYIRDSMFGFSRVHGTSMEPTLRHGDVVLVRKCELGVVLEALLHFAFGSDSSSHKDGETAAIERARLLRYEQSDGRPMPPPVPVPSILGVPPPPPPQHIHPVSRLYECPPVALTGHVVVYKNPQRAFPNEYCIKRVIGVSGQYVRMNMNDNSSSIHNKALVVGDKQRRRLQRSGGGGAGVSGGKLISVPMYSLYVEGDNLENSQDSRQLGPIPKGLVVGVAEYVVWPPTRWQRIRRQIPKSDKNDEHSQPRSFWP